MFAIHPSSCPDPCNDAHRRAALGEAVDWAYGGVSPSRPRCGSRFADARPRMGLSEALADPIVQALMAADGTDRDGVEAMMRRGSAAGEPQPGRSARLHAETSMTIKRLVPTATAFA
jgi:hypothetical protein